jgi:hypothetical protein
MKVYRTKCCLKSSGSDGFELNPHSWTTWTRLRDASGFTNSSVGLLVKASRETSTGVSKQLKTCYSRQSHSRNEPSCVDTITYGRKWPPESTVDEIDAENTFELLQYIVFKFTRSSRAERRPKRFLEVHVCSSVLPYGIVQYFVRWHRSPHFGYHS